MRSLLKLGIEPDAFTSTQVFMACAVEGRQALAPAVDLLRRLQLMGAPLEPQAYGDVMSLCAARGDAELALEIFRELEAGGVEPNLHVYSQLLLAFERCYMWKEASELHRDLRDRGLIPTRSMYNTLIGIFAGLQFWDEIPKLLQDMRDTGVHLDSTTYMLAIRASAHADQKDAAFELLWESWRAGVDTLHPMTYVALVSCCARSGDWNAAVGLLTDMKSRGLVPHKLAYKVAVRALRSSAMDDMADELELACSSSSSAAVREAEVVATGERPPAQS